MQEDTENRVKYDLMKLKYIRFMKKINSQKTQLLKGEEKKEEVEDFQCYGCRNMSNIRE